MYLFFAKYTKRKNNTDFIGKYRLHNLPLTFYCMLDILKSKKWEVCNEILSKTNLVSHIKAD